MKKERKKSGDPIAIVTISDGIVDNVKLFHNVEKAEIFFCFVVSEMDDNAIAEDYLTDGFYVRGNKSVCLTHPEVIE